ncbi:ribonuclease P protein subunit p29 [Eupeodes corollae]|uniref:ribonuclease P protein subunit p29 n=1 Tax=Eupeodes corollae TaxID=290404 RepID=UPI002490F982|nr:ribonuclease P protein subunit p29 [Eupeodes corollae]
MSADIQITNIKELLTEMVVPAHRPNVNIIPDHITMLHGTKSKKQLNRKRKTNKSTTLNRREFQQLGLHTLPTKLLKYKDVLPLNKLWKGYIKEHLNLKNGDTIPEVYEPNYDAFSKLLVKSDLHGAKISVTQSKCPSLIGLEGIVVLDTKNVLKIVGEDNKLRTIPKSECVFGMRLGNITFTLFGKHLNIRSAERSVKKIKNFIEPDL